MTKLNNILKLRPIIRDRSHPRVAPKPNLKANRRVEYDKLIVFIEELERIKEYWLENKFVNGALVGIYYDSIVPKSGRVQLLFKKGYKESSEGIVGAKFSDEKNLKHIITHFVSIESLEETIELIYLASIVLKVEFNAIIKKEDFSKEWSINFNKYKLTQNKFKQIIVDLSLILKFDLVESEFIENNQDSIITLYQTNQETIKLLKNIGINITKERVINDNTVLLRPAEISILKSRAPYLISMGIVDLAELSKNDFDSLDDYIYKIPNPSNEPTIGVIDTMFDESVYFSKWVEFKNTLSKEIELDPRDFIHGTSVSSIIVDGPKLNPKLEDGCGRFKVRHFGVASHRQFSSFEIIKKIIEIVNNNKDIKVWNLSLGSIYEVNRNFISFEGAILDKLQNELDVIFVIAGTNKPTHIKESYRIGAPADSINSVIVNAVNQKDQPASYSRKGIVLSFFHKPDISYYGGDDDEKMKVYTPFGVNLTKGTSFAAPWIARKLSYMIDILGLSREVAKALLIDSAIDWKKENTFKEASYLGRGIVPIHINNIVKSKKDEIKFFITGNATKYETYLNNLPVPKINDMYPYKTKGTLCYFPKTNRNQGVDYTQTELDLYFGRIKNDGSINSVNRNTQSYEGSYINEETARDNFRKWDNVKHIREVVGPRSRALLKYKTDSWGFKINKKSRRNSAVEKNLNFGLVITLKEINGVNRIDDFKKQCLFRGISVDEINIETIIDVYNKAEETIEFDI